MAYSGGGGGGARSRSRSPRRDGPPRSFDGAAEDGCKLYVGNLSFQTQSNDLRDYFGTVMFHPRPARDSSLLLCGIPASFSPSPLMRQTATFCDYASPSAFGLYVTRVFCWVFSLEFYFAVRES
jgi:hypothetical protein